MLLGNQNNMELNIFLKLTLALLTLHRSHRELTVLDYAAVQDKAGSGSVANYSDLFWFNRIYSGFSVFHSDLLDMCG